MNADENSVFMLVEDNKVIDYYVGKTAKADAYLERETYCDKSIEIIVLDFDVLNDSEFVEWILEEKKVSKKGGEKLCS